MPNPATVVDVENRFRPLTNDEAVVAQTLLDDAWWLLLARRPMLEANMADGTVLVGNVTRVVASMVVRVLRNPDGKRSEQIDDYSYTRDSSLSSGGLTVLPEELVDVTPVGGRPRVGSVRTVAHGEY